MASLPAAPSKALLSALRGLAVGPSCSLAVLLEDWRRRIRQAYQVLAIRDECTSARNYHVAGTAFLLALEEEALQLTHAGPGPSFPSTEPPPGLPHASLHGPAYHTEAGEARRPFQLCLDRWRANYCTASAATIAVDAPEASFCNEPTPLETTDPSSHARHGPPKRLKPTTFVKDSKRPTYGLLSPRTSPPETPATARDATPQCSNVPEFPSAQRIVWEIHRVCGSRKYDELGGALRLFYGAHENRIAPHNTDKSWMDASALLCRTCQDMGRIHDAYRILRSAVGRGLLHQVHYLSHRPYDLISALVLYSRHMHAKPGPRTKNVQALEALNSAAELYTLSLARKKGRTVDRDAAAAGLALLSWAFELGYDRGLDIIYWRAYATSEEGLDIVTEKYMSSLVKNQHYKRALRLFLTNFSKTSPSTHCVEHVIDMAVQSVEKVRGYKTAKVLRTIVELCAGRCRIKTSWVIRLLLALWEQHKSFGMVELLFKDTLAEHLDMKVAHIDGVYRVMVEIALEAREEAKAEEYFRHAIRRFPNLAADATFRGLFARFKARSGDWEGVINEFVQIQRTGSSWTNPRAVADALVPVLQALMETHHEPGVAEEFLRYFVVDLNVPINKYMVTLVANAYGKARDVDSFCLWLQFCAGAGLKMDAAFSNAILANCFKYWRFSFHQLRRVFSHLRQLGRQNVDHVTVKIMLCAAHRNTKHIRTRPSRVRARTLSLEINSASLVSVDGTMLSCDLPSLMKDAIESGEPCRALEAYKRAEKAGITLSRRLLVLASEAILAKDEHNLEAVYKLLRTAQTKGADISDAVNFVAIKQIRAINHIMGPQEVLHAVQSTLRRTASLQAELSAPLYNHAARKLYRSGNFSQALALACRAAGVAKCKGPCYDVYNFMTFLESSVELLDLEAVRASVKRGLHSFYRDDPFCLKGLKQARRRLKKVGKCTDPATAAEMATVLDTAIDKVLHHRRLLTQQKAQVENEVLGMMSKAARDTEHVTTGADDLAMDENLCSM